MIDDLILLFESRILISVITANILSHIFKFFFDLRKGKKIDISSFFKSGGMPSAHSASVMALCTAIYLSEGITSLFIVTLFFSLLVLYDARGVRYEASKHAKLLNMIMEKGKLKFPKLKEIIGHNVTEVVAGSALGIIIAILVFLF